MLKPDPLQLEGAAFLAARSAALLADVPGFGKTGQAIVAADYVLANPILVVTTATARANWKREFGLWSPVPRKTFVAYGKRDTIPADAELVIVAWSNHVASVL